MSLHLLCTYARQYAACVWGHRTAPQQRKITRQRTKASRRSNPSLADEQAVHGRVMLVHCMHKPGLGAHGI